MPLAIEVRAGGAWREAGRLQADIDFSRAFSEGRLEGGGSLSHNGPFGRQVYWFACLGGTSVIMHSRAGIDVLHDGGVTRAIHAAEGFEEVARLDSEQPHFECWLRPDGSRELRRFRFRHE